MGEAWMSADCGVGKQEVMVLRAIHSSALGVS